MPRAHALPYVAAQCIGAVLGAWLAHAMFEQPLIQISGTVRSGPGQWLAELVATAGLMLTIRLAPAGQAAPRVAAYIGAAYWFTASTSFANPAATWGRMWTDSFAGIAPASVAAFVIAQLLGAWTGTVLARLLRPGPAAAPP
jgi:glycerol uptake facilitator-like aquaporin